MAAIREWRARLCYLKLTFTLLDRAVCSVYIQRLHKLSNLGAVVSLPW